ncbi:response regulator [Myxococcota bacterium]|nr:response regulator [Myxococcota bacterium]
MAAARPRTEPRTGPDLSGSAHPVRTQSLSQGMSEWGAAEKCFRMSLFSLCASLLATALLVAAQVYQRAIPFLDPDGLRLQLHMSYAVIGAWSVLTLVAAWAKQNRPDDHWLGHVCIQLFSISNAIFAYMMGPFTNPYIGLVLIGGLSVSLPMFGLRASALGVASFAVIIGLTSAAAQTDWIPYAPLMRTAPYVDQQLSSIWFYGLGGFCLAAVTLTFWAYTRIILRWRLREDRLLVTHRELEHLSAELERAKIELEELVSEQNTELEITTTRLSMESAAKGRITEELHSLTTAMESAVEGIARVDELGRLRSVNPSFAAMHGYESRELDGMEVNRLVHPDHWHALDEGIRSLSKIGRQEIEAAGVRSDGQQFSQNIVMVPDPGGRERAHYRFARDVTQQKELLEALHQGQKMDALGRLAGGVAHDFNNVLTAVLLTVDRLKDRFSTEPRFDEEKELLQWISDAADKAAGLTSQLLAFARPGQSVSTAIDINDQIRSVVGILESTLDVSNDVVVDLESGNPTTAGDPSRFDSCLMNLALNGRDAMPNGGKLLFRSRLVHIGAADAISAAFDLKPGKFVRIDVCDEGEGISPEVAAKIFDPFFSTKPKGKGTGLGLSLVYTYLKEIGGAVRIQPGSETGTVVSMFVPLTADARTTPDVPDSNAGVLRHGKVLIVEDDATVTQAMREILARAGYDVSICRDGVEAIEFYREHGESIDLILMDLRMPRLDGAQAYHELRKIDPGVRIVVSSGNAERKEIDELMQNGLAGYLKKPFMRNELLQLIDRLLIERS